MRGRFLLAPVATAIVASGVLWGGGASFAQTDRSVWDGVYSNAQAGRGQVQYRQHCARCHGADLAGTFETPPLVGRFMPYWGDTTLDVLMDYVHDAMPLDRPGSLSSDIDADILAFLLNRNGLPPGQGDLGSDAQSLKAIRFQAVKPQAPIPALPAKGR